MGRWNKQKSPTAQAQADTIETGGYAQQQIPSKAVTKSTGSADVHDDHGFWEVSPAATQDKCNLPSSQSTPDQKHTQENDVASPAHLADPDTLARQDSELIALEAMYPDVFEEGNIHSDEPRAVVLCFATTDGSTLRLRADLPTAYPAKEPPSFVVRELPGSAPAAEGEQLLQDLQNALTSGALFNEDTECLLDVVAWLLSEGVPSLEDRMRAKATAGSKATKKGKDGSKPQSGATEMQRVSYWFASVGPKGDRIGALQSEFPEVTGIIAINARPSMGVFEGPRTTMDNFVKELRAQGNNRGQLGLSEKASEVASVKDAAAAANWRKFDKLLRVSIDEVKEMLTERGLMQPFRR
jgi:hypothetical protein